MTENIPTFTEDQTLEEKLKALEKANRGLVADLAEKREALRVQEERLSHVEQSLSSAASENGENNEQRVTRLASDPDDFIEKKVNEVITPLMQELHQLRLNDSLNRARKWVAKREKIDPDEVDEKLGEELARIGRERGLVKLSPEEGVKASYEILLQERREKEERESNRNNSINQNGTETVRSNNRSSNGTFTREQIAAMSTEEYTQNEAAIKKAIREGKLTYSMDRG